MGQAAWIWWFSGGVLAVAGLALLWWSLFRDRARGRRRCPKCWYDLSGVPGLRCPECGRAARCERRLGRTRRNWRRAWLGLAMGAIGLGMASTPRVRALGPASLLPTSVLVLCAPQAEEASRLTDLASRDWTEALRFNIIEEISRRVERGGLAPRQWRHLILRKHMISARRNGWDPSSVDVFVSRSLCRGTVDQLWVCSCGVDSIPVSNFIGPVWVDPAKRPGTSPRGYATAAESGSIGPDQTALVQVARGLPISAPAPAPGSALSFLLNGTGQSVYPDLTARLLEPGAKAIILDVSHLRFVRGGPGGYTLLDEPLELWRQRLEIPIADAEPSSQ